ncbi:MAG: hypothetical protein D6732_21605 [Methanobacteriota archaeon]|nr:MAG: hypothetical protein D6732_21605 [Euryarchaeota archaeon]
MQSSAFISDLIMESLLDNADEEKILVEAINYHVNLLKVKDIILLRKSVQGVFTLSSRYPQWRHVQEFGMNNAKILQTLKDLGRWKRIQHSHYEQFEGTKTLVLAGRIFLPLIRSYGINMGEEHLIMLVLHTRKGKKPRKKDRIEAGLSLAALMKVFAMRRQIGTLRNLVGAFAEEITQAYRNMPFEIESHIAPDYYSDMNQIIPIAFSAFLDEAVGPVGFVSSPFEFDLVLISRSIVASFAVVDFELVNISDFILNTSHQSLKIDGTTLTGTLMSLFFSRPMPSARGGFELHSLNIFVNEAYQSHLTSFAPAFKAHLYHFGKKYLQILEKYPSMIPSLSDSQLDQLKREVFGLITDLRVDLTTHLLNPPKSQSP